MKIKYRPLGPNIVIEPEIEKVRQSGVIIEARHVDDRPCTGTVILLGEEMIMPGGVKMPFGVKIGDKVEFKMFGASKVDIDGKECLEMRIDNVLGVWE